MENENASTSKIIEGICKLLQYFQNQRDYYTGKWDPLRYIANVIR